MTRSRGTGRKVTPRQEGEAEGRECTLCGVWKPIDQFYWRSRRGKNHGVRRPQGAVWSRDPTCADCHSMRRIYAHWLALFRAMTPAELDRAEAEVRADLERRLDIIEMVREERREGEAPS